MLNTYKRRVAIFEMNVIVAFYSTPPKKTVVALVCEELGVILDVSEEGHLEGS